MLFSNSFIAKNLLFLLEYLFSSSSSLLIASSIIALYLIKTPSFLLKSLKLSINLINLFKLFLFVAHVSITGTFNFFSSSFIFILIPFLLASSIKFTQTIKFLLHSIICYVKLIFLSKIVASVTIKTKSYLPKQIKSLDTSSSFDEDVSEYVPGKSTNV